MLIVSGAGHSSMDYRPPRRESEGDLGEWSRRGGLTQLTPCLHEVMLLQGGTVAAQTQAPPPPDVLVSEGLQNQLGRLDCSFPSRQRSPTGVRAGSLRLAIRFIPAFLCSLGQDCVCPCTVFQVGTRQSQKCHWCSAFTWRRVFLIASRAFLQSPWSLMSYKAVGLCEGTTPFLGCP